MYSPTLVLAVEHSVEDFSQRGDMMQVIQYDHKRALCLWPVTAALLSQA
jgi:hypothetical protein